MPRHTGVQPRSGPLDLAAMGAAEWPLFAEPQNRWWATADRLLAEYDTLAIIGGNRSSKSRWGWRTMGRAAMGAYPWCRTPMHGAFISLSKNQGSTAFQEYIEHYFLTMPKEIVVRQTTREELTTPIRIVDGSRVDVKTIEMGASRIQGAGYNLVMIDEEDGQLRRIYKELVARARAGQPLKIVFLASPTQGVTWLYREIIAKAPEKRIAVLPVSVFENAHGTCQTCGVDRDTWDRRLKDLGWDRSSHTHVQRGALCKRCYTFGQEPRITPDVIARWNEEYTTRTEIGVRFYGEWPLEGGLSCFTPAQIKAMRVSALPPVRTEGPFRWYVEPEQGHAYAGAVDCAHGTDRDETVQTLVDVHSGEQVCCWGDPTCEPASYITDVAGLAHEYGGARHWVENIGAGIYVIEELLARGVPLYRHRAPTRRLRASPRLVYGWQPSLRTRDALLERMISAVKRGLVEVCACHAGGPCPDGKPMQGWLVVRGRPGAVYVNDAKTIDQLERLQWPHEENTRIDVDEGHDDRAFAIAGAAECRRDGSLGGIARPVARLPRREDRVDRTWLATPGRWGTHPLARGQTGRVTRYG